MSVPMVPGYTVGAPSSLADEWARPEGDFPDELWPIAELRRISHEPTDWVTVEEHTQSPSARSGVSCVLIDLSSTAHAIERVGWLGSHLGRASVWDGEGFLDGLSDDEDDVRVQFFCQVRDHHGLALPSVEISYPFLWYWDAIKDGGDWYFLNVAGRDEELIRTQANMGSYKVEVKAFALRKYLVARNLAMVLQHDFVPHTTRSDFSRVQDEYRSDWCHFTWVCDSMPPLGPEPGFSRLLGKYVILPLASDPGPRWDERDQERSYPEFQYGIDARSGEALRHTCDPDALGTYFDDDPSRLHYLTPVYFRRDVLARYTSEPSRYRVTATRLSCLDLWGLEISTNTAGLVEVYLGDLGRDLPPDEWPHWLAHNVAPAGQMTEDRFRRDFLAEFSDPQDIPGDLRRARESACRVSMDLLGAPLWKDLVDPPRREFEALHAPVSRDPSALTGPVLTLCKALVDAIDPDPLKAYLGDEANELRQLQLLDLFVTRLGGNPEISAAFRGIYNLRSAGGIAHLSGSGRDAVLHRAGIAGMTPGQAFDALCLRLTRAILELEELMASRSLNP